MPKPNNIVFTSDIGATFGGHLQAHQYSQVAVLVDENTLRHCFPKVKPFLPQTKIIEIPSGEEHKNLETCTHIWQALTDAAFDRKSLLVNLGGGVIGDMGGFCAATYKRGIDFTNIPTTLLAQVDASIGGKLGIDFNHFKNHIGVFKGPQKVFIDPGFLGTLDPRELRSGFAEVIKHGLIADARSFDRIYGKTLDELDWEPIIRDSVRIKNEVVEADPKEQGYRKVLNFGHTVGHAVESHYLTKPGKRLLHGEAIAVGMVCEAFLSTRKTGLGQEALMKITDYLLKIYKPETITETDIPAIASLTLQDKKNEQNTILCSLLKGIGDCAFNVGINEQDIQEAIGFYNRQLQLVI